MGGVFSGKVGAAGIKTYQGSNNISGAGGGVNSVQTVYVPIVNGYSWA